MSVIEKVSLFLPKGFGDDVPNNLYFFNPQNEVLEGFTTEQNTALLHTVSKDKKELFEVDSNTAKRDYINSDSCGALELWRKSTNFVVDNKTPSNWYNAQVTPTNEGAFEMLPSFSWGKYTQTGLQQNIGFVSSPLLNGENWVISTYVKTSESGDYIALRETGGGLAVMRISDSTITSGGAGVSSFEVENTGFNDIKRLVIKGQTQGDNRNFFFVIVGSDGSTQTNDGNTLQITGFCFEKGFSETPLIPCSGSMETRLKFELKNESLGSSFDGSKFGFYINYKPHDLESTGYVEFTSIEGSEENLIRIFKEKNEIYLEVFIDFVNVYSAVTTIENNYQKMYFFCGENGAGIYKNGLLVEETTVNLDMSGKGINKVYFYKGESVFEGSFLEIGLTNYELTENQKESLTEI